MNECRWIQVKTANGGGVRQPELPPTATYEDVLEKAKELFFQDGTKTNDLTFVCVCVCVCVCVKP